MIIIDDLCRHAERQHGNRSQDHKSAHSQKYISIIPAVAFAYLAYYL
jgi:hypothetical protein